MRFEEIPKYQSEITSYNDIEVYKLEDLKKSYQEFFPIGDNYYLFLTSEEVNTRYAFFVFSYSYSDEEIYVRKLFQRVGTTYDRSMRHTYFGEEDNSGYISYLHISEMIHTLKILKNYFD